MGFISIDLSKSLRLDEGDANRGILQFGMTPPARARATASRPAPPARQATPSGVSTASEPSTEARAARAWLHSARFLTTASRLDQLPQGDLPEIAFVGRSNAGKSSAINALAQQRQLAFASKTPGRTQHINLFALGPREAADAYLADLPGYGYAAVDRGKKLEWQQVMADYLEVRRALAGVVLMVDSRHGFTPLDRRLLDFIAQRVRTGEVRLLALLTKADKLTKTEARTAVAAAQEALGDYVTESSDIGVTLFSSLRRVGTDDVAEALRGWIAPAEGFATPPPSATPHP
jgi:GTP-binding protein